MSQLSAVPPTEPKEALLVPTGRHERFCIACGQWTHAVRCERDNAPTFDLQLHEVTNGPLAVGDSLAGYRVTAVLGRGGHATVYRAEHHQGLGEVALKVLHVQQITTRAIQRLYREARIGANLKHPNTVRVHEVGQSPDGLVYLVMELIGGQTLASRLRDLTTAGRTMAVSEALHIGIEVCKGLADAHSQHVIHRDLKPGNVMLVQAGDDLLVKLVDFGVAQMVGASGLTETGQAMGTPAYMSPEQCKGEVLDGRSDLYALALMLYECLAGKPPFQDNNVLQLMYAHTGMAPPDLTTLAPHVPADVAAVVLRGLAKDPAQRYADAAAMRKALEACRAQLDGAGTTSADFGRPVAPQQLTAHDPLGTPAPVQVVDTRHEPQVEATAGTTVQLAVGRPPSVSLRRLAIGTAVLALLAMWAAGSGGPSAKPRAGGGPAAVPPRAAVQPAALVPAEVPGQRQEAVPKAGPTERAVPAPVAVPTKTAASAPMPVQPGPGAATELATAKTGGQPDPKPTQAKTKSRTRKPAARADEPQPVLPP